MKQALLMVALVVVQIPVPAHADQDWQSGNGMLELCTDNIDSDTGLCLGRINGLDAGLAFSKMKGSASLVCIPSDVTMSRRRDVLVAYLKEHPDRRQIFWGTLALAAWSSAWPCPSGFSMKYNPATGKFDY